jgi:hypothetical protein
LKPGNTSTTIKPKRARSIAVAMGMGRPIGRPRRSRILSLQNLFPEKQGDPHRMGTCRPGVQFWPGSAMLAKRRPEELQRHRSGFNAIEADLHNLTPSIGEINADRSNYRFGVLPTTPKQHGDCDFKVDFKGRTAEPRDEVKGQAARIYFYMHDRYNMLMSQQQHSY